MVAGRADYSRLTNALRSRSQDIVTLSWQELDEIVGGLPRSAVDHYPQWWHGDRSHTLAWRRAGFVLESVELERSVTFRKTEASVLPPDETRTQCRSYGPRVVGSEPVGTLMRVAPRAVLLVIGCSARKVRGGDAVAGGSRSETRWPGELLAARARLSAAAQLDERLVLPAWRRYTGHFYQSARDVLPDAAASGRVVILSGGLGLVQAGELIGHYDRRLALADWPPGLLERLLIEEARKTGATSVVGFVAQTSEYARLLRRVAWGDSGVKALAVTIDHQGGGAQREVPSRLGRAFAAFWRQEPADFPPGMRVEALS